MQLAGSCTTSSVALDTCQIVQRMVNNVNNVAVLAIFDLAALNSNKPLLNVCEKYLERHTDDILDTDLSLTISIVALCISSAWKI